MSEAPVTTDVHETLDVHGHFGAQGPFDLVVTLDLLTQLVHVVIGEIDGTAIRIHSGALEDPS
jgi:hypothetical protein